MIVIELANILYDLFDWYIFVSKSNFLYFNAGQHRLRSRTSTFSQCSKDSRISRTLRYIVEPRVRTSGSTEVLSIPSWEIITHSFQLSEPVVKERLMESPRKGAEPDPCPRKVSRHRDRHQGFRKVGGSGDGLHNVDFGINWRTKDGAGAPLLHRT